MWAKSHFVDPHRWTHLVSLGVVVYSLFFSMLNASVKGFGVKTMLPFCFAFSSQFWRRPMPESPAALWATSTKEFRVARLIRVRHQRACMHAWLRTICPLHRDLGEALCGGRQAQPVLPEWAAALGSLNQQRPGTGLIHPGVPSI